MKPIGKGLYGTIYLAYDQVNNREVAIKEFISLEQGRHEAYVMKKYGVSKHLPTFYESFSNRGKAYIVMEYIKGETFKQKQ